LRIGAAEFLVLFAQRCRAAFSMSNPAGGYSLAAAELRN
jgi:hypothetical protein